MKKRYLIFAIILVFFEGFSQENKNDFSANKLVEEIASSPEVSNLATYGKFSANGYNGMANISIPVYTTYYTYKTPSSHSYKVKLLKAVTSQFLGGKIVNEQTNTYNLTTHHLTETRQKIENGDLLTSKFYYPYDTEIYSNTGMNILRSENRIGKIIKSENFKNSILLNTQITNYISDGSTFYRTLPSDIQYVKGTSGSTNPFVTGIKYEQYDQFGKIRQARKPDGTPVTYIWGYNGLFPVAKIENATYSEVENLTSFGSGFNLGYGGLSSTQEDTLRTSLSNAMVTTYTYDPLIGVTSTTDPSGYTSYYAYDAFNRLKIIRDEDNKILKEYSYNYKNN